MKILILFAFSWISLNANAWYCLEVASERQGDIINACGIGEAIDEDAARKVALNNAYKELDLICSHSSDCADKALDITPLRTECKKVENIYRCHRGVTANITSKPRDLSQTQFLQEIFIPKKIIQQDGSNYFQKTSIVDFNTRPEGARVHVDGVEICQTPCTKEIDQGEHKLSYEKEDYEFLNEVQKVVEGRQTISTNLQLRFGYLTIAGLPADAIIKVDNKEISSKDKIRLNPNEHVITVTSKNFQPWYKQFQIKKGAFLEFKYDAEPLLGHVKISATDHKGNPIEAVIYINGEKISQKTPTALPLKAGKNFITLSNPDFKDLSFEITLNVDEKLEIRKELVPFNYKSGAWYLGLGISPAPFKDFSKEEKFSCCMLIDLAFQKNLSNHFSLKFSYNYSGDTTSDEASYNSDNGSPNTTAYKVSEASGHLLFVSMPIYFSKDDHFSWYLAPEFGQVKSILKYDQYIFDAYGNGYKGTTNNEASFTQAFRGLALGGEWLDLKNSKPFGWYLIFGMRKYEEIKDSNFSFNKNKTQAPTSNSTRGYGTIGWMLAY
jgi:hypothetical protein